VASYRVCFDGKWQGDFEDLDEALAWGREVGETGRIAHVVHKRLLYSKLVAVFPEDQVDTGRWLWRIRARGGGDGDPGIP
jgi:hypothetical protein